MHWRLVPNIFGAMSFCVGYPKDISWVTPTIPHSAFIFSPQRTQRTQRVLVIPAERHMTCRRNGWKSEEWKIGSLFAKWSLLEYSRWQFCSIALRQGDGWNYRDLALRISPIAVPVGTVGHRPPIDWRVVSPELAQSRMDEAPVKEYKDDLQI